MQLTKDHRIRLRRSLAGVGVAALIGSGLVHGPAAQASLSEADFYDTLDLDRSELADVAAAVAESDFAAADEALAAFYADRETPVYFPVEGRAQAISNAMDIADGRFEWAGDQVRDYFDPDTGTIDVDWDDPWDEYVDPPVNAPSRMNRFIFNHYLTDAYQALPADDPRREELAVAWMQISLDFIADKGDVPIGAAPHNRLTEGIRLTNWLEAFSVFKDSPAVSAADMVTYLDYIRQMSDDIKNNIDNHKGNNWYISLGRALYLSAIYLPEFEDSSTWRFKALGVADRYVNRNMRSDGLSYEPTVHYQNYALSLIATIQRFGTLNGDEPFTDPELSFFVLQAEALAATTMPNFTIPLFGDSQDAELSLSGVETIADELGRDDLKWVATDGASGTKPTWESKLFPESYATMRSGWDEDDQYLFIGNQDTAYNASHRHPDDLSVVAYAYGRPLVVDPGAYDYSNSDSARWMRRTTEAHNTVEVGGEPQPKSRRADPSARRTLRWYSNDGFDFYEGSHEDYDPITHERSVFSPKPGFWIVSDVLTGSTGSEDYRQLWHFPADASVSIDGETEAVHAGFGDVPGVVVAPVDPDGTSTEIHDDGYLTDGYQNLYSDVEYASFSQSTSGAATFDTVLYPGDAGTAPSLGTSRLQLDVPRDTATAMRLDLPGGDDGVYYVTREEKPSARSVGDFEFDGRLFYAERNAAGKLSRFSLAAGSELTEGGTTLLSSADPVNDLSVQYDGSRVVLSTGEPLQADLTVHAPGASDIVLNGSSVPFTTDGDSATISAPSLVPSGPPLVEDTFSDAHDDIFGTWDFEDGRAGGWHGLPNKGSWSVNQRDGGNVYQQTDRNQIDGMAIVEDSATDVAVEATVERGRVGSSHHGYGIALRMHDERTHYMARVYRTPDGVWAELFKRVGGDRTNFAREPLSIDPAEQHTLRASMSGDVLRFWIDGELVATAVDDEIPNSGIPSGGIGLQAHRAASSFDDITVEKLADTTKWSASRGTFVDTDGELTMQASGIDRSRFDLARTVLWEDYVAGATFRPEHWGESGELGLAVRSTKDTLGYRAVLVDDGTGQFARIERYTGGSYATIEPTVIAETPVSFSTNEPLPVQVVARGSTIELWLDGELLTSATDTVIGRGGVSIIGSDVNAGVTDLTVRELIPVDADVSAPGNHRRPGQSIPVFVELADAGPGTGVTGTPQLSLRVTAPDGAVSDVPLRGDPRGRLTGLVRTERELPGTYEVQLLWSGLPVRIAELELEVGAS